MTAPIDLDALALGAALASIELVLGLEPGDLRTSEDVAAALIGAADDELLEVQQILNAHLSGEVRHACMQALLVCSKPMTMQ